MSGIEISFTHSFPSSFPSSLLHSVFVLSLPEQSRSCNMIRISTVRSQVSVDQSINQSTNQPTNQQSSSYVKDSHGVVCCPLKDPTKSTMSLAAVYHKPELNLYRGHMILWHRELYLLGPSHPPLLAVDSVVQLFAQQYAGDIVTSYPSCPRWPPAF